MHRACVDPCQPSLLCAGTRGILQVYVGSSDKSMYAIDAMEGNGLWQVATGDEVFSSPALSADGTVLFAASNDKHLYAIKANASHHPSYYFD